MIGGPCDDLLVEMGNRTSSSLVLYWHHKTSITSFHLHHTYAHAAPYICSRGNKKDLISKWLVC